MVHTFTALGQYLAADVNSGAVHELDRLSYDLLSLADGPLGDALPGELAEKLPQYDLAALEESWGELKALQDQRSERIRSRIRISEADGQDRGGSGRDPMPLEDPAYLRR